MKYAVLLFLCMLTLGADELSPIELDASVSRGLTFLAHQQQGDGSFVGFDDPGPRSAPTAVALLAFLGCGHMPAAGQYDLVVHNALDFLLRQAPDDGYLGRADGSGMEGQAVITIALAESYGVENDAWQRKQLGPTLQNALQAILAMQDKSPGAKGGGWNADGQGPGKLVTTAWAVLALRSLEDAGMKPPKEALRRASEFARSCLVPHQGFSDSPQPPTTASTAAGAMILLLAETGASHDAILRSLVDLQVPASSKDLFRTEFMLAYCRLCMRTSAERQVWESLQHQQAEDGSWGTVAPSAIAVLTLSMRYRFLPLFDQ
jgi:hypothetical protein